MALSCSPARPGHLAILTRNQVQFAGAKDTVPMLAESTGTQRQAFDLEDAADYLGFDLAPPRPNRASRRGVPDRANGHAKRDRLRNRAPGNSGAE
jgi:hypothetical protein